MNGVKEKFKVIKVSDWEDVRLLCKSLNPGWIFRGQSSSEWKLIPNIERRMTGTWFTDLSLRLHEQKVIENLKSRSKYFIDHVPNDDNIIDWLALVQHHGGLTRLLDFTHSFYVAAYFALSSARQESSIWAVNYKMLINRICNKYNKDLDDPKRMLEFVNKNIYSPAKIDGVFPVVSSLLFDRILNQQGLFLFPLNDKECFEYNLLKSFDINKSMYENLQIEKYNVENNYGIYEYSSSCILRIDLSINVLHDAYKDFELMNLNYSTLFPDFDGYVKSLNDNLIYYFKKKTMTNLLE